MLQSLCKYISWHLSVVLGTKIPSRADEIQAGWSTAPSPSSKGSRCWAKSHLCNTAAALSCSGSVPSPSSCNLALQDPLQPPFDFNQSWEWGPKIIESSFIHPSSLPCCPVALSDSEVLGRAWFPSESSCGAPLCVYWIQRTDSELEKTSGNLKSTLELGLWHSCGDFSPVHTSTSSDGTSEFSRGLEALWILEEFPGPSGLVLTSKLLYFQSFN